MTNPKDIEAFEAAREAIRRVIRELATIATREEISLITKATLRAATAALRVHESDADEVLRIIDDRPA